MNRRLKCLIAVKRWLARRRPLRPITVTPIKVAPPSQLTHLIIEVQSDQQLLFTMLMIQIDGQVPRPVLAFKPGWLGPYLKGSMN